MIKTGGVIEVCHHHTGMFGELNNESNNQNYDIHLTEVLVTVVDPHQINIK